MGEYRDKHGRIYMTPVTPEEKDTSGMLVFSLVLFIVGLFGLGWLTWGL